MLLSIVFILSGFFLLIKGADYLIDGASSIAGRIGVSSLVIGLTVVAFGTSAPELAVNVLSAVSGRTELAFGNINGSNIANILLILGVTAIIAKVPVKNRTVLKEIPFMALAGSLLILLSLDTLLEGRAIAAVTRIDGLVLLSFFLVFLYYLYLTFENGEEEQVEVPKYSLPIASGRTLIGLLGLSLGGYLAVEGASAVALQLGISETLIGLTVVALGTSLPELVSSVVAARKGETDIAVGNIVGSNIFNILLVLGVSSVIMDIPVTEKGITDGVIALLAMILFFGLLFLNKEGRYNNQRLISKKEGVVLLMFYIGYMVFAIMRG